MSGINLCRKKDKVCNKIQVSFQGNMRSENKERKSNR